MDQRHRPAIHTSTKWQWGQGEGLLPFSQNSIRGQSSGRCLPKRTPCARWVIAFFLWAIVARAFIHAQVGSVIENAELPMLNGEKHAFLGSAPANVFIFFKPGQEHSRAVLKQLAVCEKQVPTNSVHWVAIVSDRFAKADIETEVKETGIAMPVLIDAGDALYGRLGVALCPVTGIADKDHKLVAYEPFAKVNYVEVIRARIRHLLKEITDQELEQVLKPPVLTQGGDTEVAHRRLKLAEKHFQAKNYEKAIESVNKSLEKDPTLAAAHALLGQILAAQGNRAEALKAFEQALKLDPANAAALEGRKACQPKTE